jgi:hypothetical protein
MRINSREGKIRWRLAGAVIALANALADVVRGMAEQAVEKQGQKITFK